MLCSKCGRSCHGDVAGVVSAREAAVTAAANPNYSVNVNTLRIRPIYEVYKQSASFRKQ